MARVRAFVPHLRLAASRLLRVAKLPVLNLERLQLTALVLLVHLKDGARHLEQVREDREALSALAYFMQLEAKLAEECLDRVHDVLL